MKRIMDNVVELKDEYGEVCKVVHFIDGTMPISGFHLMEKFPSMGMHDLRKMSVRNDDIFVLDYAKSGRNCPRRESF